jgi:error-prone DNA polymerase
MPEHQNGKLYTGSLIEPPAAVAACDVEYAELDVTTNYSFLRGASHPDELVYTAANLGYKAMAVTDINSVAGVALTFAKASPITGFKLVIGTRLVFDDGTPDVLLWPTDVEAYGRMCQLLTRGRMRAPKGECHLQLADLLEFIEGQQAAIVVPPCSCEELYARFELPTKSLRDVMGDNLSLAVSMCYDGDDRSRMDRLAKFSWMTNVPLLATNHVHYHDKGRRPLQDVLTCVRHGCTIDEAGHRLFPNAERYMKSPEQMHALFCEHPEAIRRTVTVAERCNFTLDQIDYIYPDDLTPAGEDRSKHLRAMTLAGANRRYPRGIPYKVKRSLAKELRLIYRSKYEPYFLTVYDIVNFARSRSILCQGRGSAANSAVCYCLGVTAVDPATRTLVFSRFISGSRNEPPDIDIDFEHEKREEVIQYVYEKYSRDRAAMTASLITYRGRSAIRDVGKVMGFSIDVLDAMAGKLDWWHNGMIAPSEVAEAGVDPADPAILRLLTLVKELRGFPRHLSQHVGGMVISRTPITTLVPVENATMKNRTVIEWDKDDLDVVGMFKVDILGLGMLTCLAKTLKLVNGDSSSPQGMRGGRQPLELHSIPPEDSSVYDMISDADTIGVFQVESRAQMSMLPRLKPRNFYDLVIEVAIVRPGPIQGDMVHPYLLRREGRQRDPNYPIDYAKPELEDVLKETLGVPLFQEQAMRMAIVAAKFTEQEADELRRGMAAWKRSGGLSHFQDKFIDGMVNNGYQRAFAEKCFDQIRGFGSYGFPESHAASFAILVYASAWLKRHHPAAFAAGLINSYPMGFYAPAQLVIDARNHGVTVHGVDVNASEWDCTLEDHEISWHGRPGREDMCGTPMPPSSSSSDKRTWGLNGPALRLGYRLVKGFNSEDAQRIVADRNARGPFTSVEEFHRRTGLTGASVRRLAEADAFSSLDLSRRPANWHALAIGADTTPIIDVTQCRDDETPELLPKMPAGQEVLIDYLTTGLSLKRHPVAFARGQLTKEMVLTAAALRDDADKYPHGTWAKVAGVVLVRQRPGTASGVVFMSIEDETGIANLIFWSHVYERYRPAARHATLLLAEGFVQREGKVVHLLAKRAYDRSEMMNGLSLSSRDFH